LPFPASGTVPIVVAGTLPAQPSLPWSTSAPGFSKILYEAQAALRVVNLLVEQVPQAHGIETKAPLLRPVIRVQVELAGCMAIHMTIETRDAEARLGAFAVVSWIELFLWRWRQKHAQAVELDWREEVFKQAVEIVNRDYFAPRHVPEFRSVLEKNRRGKLGKSGRDCSSVVRGGPGGCHSAFGQHGQRQEKDSPLAPVWPLAMTR
jgi:hypothetical protein